MFCVYTQLQEYKAELDRSLPAPLDTIAQWLVKAEGALAEEQGEPPDHGRAADEAREKQELLKVKDPFFDADLEGWTIWDRFRHFERFKMASAAFSCKNNTFLPILLVLPFCLHVNQQIQENE